MSKADGRALRIVVACGTGIATSTHVAIKIQEMLAARGVPVETVQCRVPEVPHKLSGADAVVATAQVPYDDVQIPTLSGLPFLTGIGEEEVIDQLERIYLDTP
ncbi:MAG: PTS sugar transporter subunit IIB [Anaerolineales bacterium]|nr:PTS sugar transporter subunit IIB [Anaerolineales bacterium]MCW5855617.1 PTS sugar transporter subunit IIB [Anaerolineales bacterium]MCW5877877.1 PTS sugar transporter subunit IIB [Anaerolineales bacterium]